MVNEFEEISHSGGKITFRLVTDQPGHRGYQVTISGNRPVPAEWIAVYALSQGIPVESIQLGGIGQIVGAGDQVMSDGERTKMSRQGKSSAQVSQRTRQP